MSFEQKIKTLDEILAEMGQPVSANGVSDGNKKLKENGENIKNKTPIIKTPISKTSIPNINTPKSTSKPKTAFNSNHSNNKKESSLDIAQDNNPLKKDTCLQDDNPIATLDFSDNQTLQEILINTPYEPLEIETKEVRYMRWLAFYYLSRRELSAYDLKQKLLAKGCDVDKVNELLIEFAKKGYQSDERCAYMIVRESVRKNRGRTHIKNALKQARLNLPYGFDELIAQAGVSVLDDESDEEVNWLKLATQARTKKYGDSIPTTPKEKARQLRFLQYRGFEMGVCLQALKMTMGDFDEGD